MAVIALQCKRETGLLVPLLTWNGSPVELVA